MYKQNHNKRFNKSIIKIRFNNNNKGICDVPGGLQSKGLQRVGHMKD